MKATPQCDEAIKHASDALERFGHTCLSSVHLLLGLLVLNRGVAKVLRKVGITLELTEHHLQSWPFKVEDATEHRGLLCGRSALMAFERAEQEAKEFNHRFLGTDHLLLAICDEEHGSARDLFDALKIDRTGMRKLLIERISVPCPFDLSDLDGLCEE